MNYASLLQQVQDFLENTETTFVSRIPDFVKQAEQLAYNSVHIPALRKSATGTLTASSKYWTVPTDFLAPFAFSVVVPPTLTQAFLLDKDVEYIREAFPNPATTGTPTHFAMFDDTQFIVGPTPDLAYAVELHYYYYPESIVTASTTWLGNNFDTVLLFGTLRIAYAFMKGETDLFAVYDKGYQEALALLKQLGDGKNRRTAYRAGQVRVPVQ